MEPYRPIIDKLILSILGKSEEYPNNLSVELKTQLLQIPVIDVNIDGVRSPLMNAVATTTASLYKCFAGESRRLLYPEV